MAEVVGETARLRLREWDPEDKRHFYDVMNRPEVMEHLGGVQSPEEWSAAYNRILGFQRDYGHTFWIVEDRTSGEILDLAFGRFEAPAVIATTVPANEASQGLMKRLGMTRREDLDYVDTRFGPDLNPTIVYWMDAGDWAAARERALKPR